MVNNTSTRDFFENEVNSSELMKRTVPESLLPALANATYLDMGQATAVKGTPYHAGFLIFEDPTDARRFASHMSGVEATEILKPEDKGSNDFYIPVSRDVTIKYNLNIGPTHTASYDTRTGQGESSVDNRVETKKTESTVPFTSVAVRGREINGEMFKEAFGCKVFKDIEKLHTDLVAQAEALIHSSGRY